MSEKIWERMEGESERNYSRFLIYRNSNERSISKLAEQFNLSTNALYGMSSRFDWQARADAYDVWVNETIAGRKEAQIVLRQVGNIDFRATIEGDAALDGALFLELWRGVVQRYLLRMQGVPPDIPSKDDPEPAYYQIDADELNKLAKARLTIDDMMRRTAGLALSTKTKEVDEKKPEEGLFYVTDES